MSDLDPELKPSMFALNGDHWVNRTVCNDSLAHVKRSIEVAVFT